MAKEQDLPLNSTKISGACGRLMCCLRYEFEAYRDFKGRAPKRNAVIETPLGKGKIIEYDTPKEQLTLRLENGKQVKVALADMEASEAAVKKSEELGCPCRPDTASRAALERLATPEVQLALAELDREMGIVPEEPEDLSDIFVEPPRSRRRRRSEPAEPVAAVAPETSEQTPETPATPSRSRRRRKKRAADTTANEAPKQAAASKQPAMRASRRTHVAEGKEDAATEAPQAKATHRRRRHHTTDAAQAPTSAKTQAAASQAADEKPAAPRRSRRRPGDRGGQAAQLQAAQASAPKQRKAAPSAPSQEGETNPARRRRRHRGGRGKGKAGAEGGAPSSNE